MLQYRYTSAHGISTSSKTIIVSTSARARIIEMATSEVARALRLGDRTGQLATGYSADLLEVDGDPLGGIGGS